ncbi:Occludin/ELL family protein [Cyanobium sp. FACHB-13342]|uniref:Occludin/ELL family protein n=1 Tax=Cyanobium sp. FACHB-13342 TaxID=2692793 RepID=UPI001F54A836|nr:Occludin/ELL family protein [Cyanobium sp. FACHB-13342]
MAIANPLTVLTSAVGPRLALGVSWAALGGLLVAPASAGPVVCTTTLEAPLVTGQTAASGPVEVTRCGVVQTTPQLMEKRFFSYTAPFARGVSLTNQVRDIFGIATGGGDGTKVMGFGFPDQTIVWDGTAVENTYQVLLEQQSDPMPWRTADVTNGYSGSLGSAGVPQQSAWQDGGVSYGAPVRGLW